MTADVANTLAERGARYGAFIEHSIISQGLQDVMRAAPNWGGLDPDIKQALTTIADKIARILNGDPYYTDNYHDIAGYSMLVENRLLGKQELFAAEPRDDVATAEKAKDSFVRTNDQCREENSDNLDSESDVQQNIRNEINWDGGPLVRIPEDIRNDIDRREGRPITFPEGASLPF